eukprot:TRINITY_DN11635_c0_g1_i2.p1 TRINITY_DN11635_c0_g1~~TRINITY_DN11635_c0_g1_i2.p1  ORF type:complete len:476 (+),score=149.40 TRINITY_DN11635_c0_g1_i2:48-1430(+)
MAGQGTLAGWLSSPPQGRLQPAKPKSAAPAAAAVRPRPKGSPAAAKRPHRQPAAAHVDVDAPSRPPQPRRTDSRPPQPRRTDSPPTVTVIDDQPPQPKRQRRESTGTASFTFGTPTAGRIDYSQASTEGDDASAGFTQASQMASQTTQRTLTPSGPPAGPQELVQGKDGHLCVVKNSPYGGARAELGWGSVFKPAVMATPKNTRIRVGVSSLGCVPPASAKGGFSSAVAEYGRKFRTLEHCAPYHKVPTDDIWKQWGAAVARVSPQFRVTVKCSKWFTHERRLCCLSEDVREHFRVFLGKCRLLGPALAAVLVQTPPMMGMSADLPAHVDEIAKVVAEEAAAAGGERIPLAFEMRSRGMHCDRMYEVLRRHDFAVVLSDHADRAVQHVDTSSRIAYFRLHGSMGRAVGDYGPSECGRHASVARHLAAQGKSVYVFFNNNESHAAGLHSSVADATYFAQQL